MGLEERPSDVPKLHDAVREHLAARQELGPEMDDQLVASLVSQFRGVIAEEVGRQVGRPGRMNEKQIADWRKEMYGITLGCGIPLLLIAGIFAGMVGVIAVCAAIAVSSLFFSLGDFRK